MKPFYFLGTITASKSLRNRALIAKSFFPELQLGNSSSCDDVVYMEKAISALAKNEAIPCGHAGTVLRFMAIRASRQPGVHRLEGSERLFSRPQQPLVSIMNQLGCEVDLQKDHMIIKSQGWKPVVDSVHVPTGQSSQFASALLLSCWNLDKPFYMTLNGDFVSESYFRMTKDLLSLLGLTMEIQDGRDIYVPEGQTLLRDDYFVEMDMSSAFAVACVAAVSGSATFLQFPENSLQPDYGFIDILKSMKIDIEQTYNQLAVKQTATIHPTEADLKQMPDLFPCLAVLCAFAEGTSRLFGATHLKFKESDRLEKIKELLKLIGREFQEIEGGLEISGRPFDAKEVAATPKFTYDPDKDHRLAFSAGILMRLGYQIDLLTPDVVSKSFPEFWNVIGVPE